MSGVVNCVGNGKVGPKWKNPRQPFRGLITISGSAVDTVIAI
jgi:hypothetical protein